MFVLKWELLYKMHIIDQFLKVACSYKMEKFDCSH